MTHLSHPLATLAVTFLILTLGYILACVVWPFAACRRCHGTGRLRTPLGRAFRLCPRCHATGHRIRIGRHAWNELRRLHHTGTRPTSRGGAR